MTGGADPSGHEYAWKLTNEGASSIVEVRIPHYRANLFFPPDGWESSCTGLVAVGAKNEPGLCTVKPASGKEGLTPGRSVELRMQIAAAGAKRRAGSVVVRFADGAEFSVAGVELPTRESSGDRYVAPTGLGLIIMILAFRNARRKRRRQRIEASGTNQA